VPTKPYSISLNLGAIYSSIKCLYGSISTYTAYGRISTYTAYGSISTYTAYGSTTSDKRITKLTK
jgi:hypothetical protein